MRPIIVVFICDENYAMPTTVAITSLKCNKSSGVSYNVYVLGVSLSEESKAKFEVLSDTDFEVKVLERELSEEQRNVVICRERVTLAALLKFDLPIIFNQYDKLIYLDSDIVVQKDLLPLFEIDIENQYAAVVKDTMTVRGKNAHLKMLEFKPEAYFNSGMLLLNLKKMREEDIPDKLLQYRLNGKNKFMDQDALNVVFDGNVKYVSPYYNLLNCFFEWQTIDELGKFYGVEFPHRRSEVFRNATVLHFGDKKKPWQYKMGYLSKLYMRYYNKSPYKNIPLQLEEVDEYQALYSSDSPIHKMIFGGIKCLRENGIKYTLRRIKEKIFK